MLFLVVVNLPLERVTFGVRVFNMICALCFLFQVVSPTHMRHALFVVGNLPLERVNFGVRVFNMMLRAVFLSQVVGPTTRQAWSSWRAWSSHPVNCGVKCQCFVCVTGGWSHSPEGSNSGGRGTSSLRLMQETYHQVWVLGRHQGNTLLVSVKFFIFFKYLFCFCFRSCLRL